MNELWFFDLTGYLIVPAVMGPAWVAAANTAYDWITEDDEQVLEAVQVKL